MIFLVPAVTQRHSWHEMPLGEAAIHKYFAATRLLPTDWSKARPPSRSGYCPVVLEVSTTSSHRTLLTQRRTRLTQFLSMLAQQSMSIDQPIIIVIKLIL